MNQTIRFVGGPYHGRVLAMSEATVFVQMPVMKGRAPFADGTFPDPFGPITETVRYYREWLGRSTPTLQVREQVMLFEALRPSCADAVARWQELRAA